MPPSPPRASGLGYGHHPISDGARLCVYLAVVLDWFSRRVLSWRLSITMEAAFCVETLEDAHSSLDGKTPDRAYFTPLPSAWQPTAADAPLIDAEKLFRQPRPSLHAQAAASPH